MNLDPAKDTEVEAAKAARGPSREGGFRGGDRGGFSGGRSFGGGSRGGFPADAVDMVEDEVAVAFQEAQAVEDLAVDQDEILEILTAREKAADLISQPAG